MAHSVAMYVTNKRNRTQAIINNYIEEKAFLEKKIFPTCCHVDMKLIVLLLTFASEIYILFYFFLTFCSPYFALY